MKIREPVDARKASLRAYRRVYNTTDLGQFVTVDQENQGVDFILDHIVLFLPLEILLSGKFLQEN